MDAGSSPAAIGSFFTDMAGRLFYFTVKTAKSFRSSGQEAILEAAATGLLAEHDGVGHA